MNTQFDIVIAGGGLVGASLASALAPGGLRVALVEAIAPSAAQPSFDDRATALSASSAQILAAIGHAAVVAGGSPIETIHVSDRGRFGATRLDARRHAVAAFGYVIENRLMGEALWAGLAASEVTVLCPAGIVAVEQEHAGLRVDVRGAGIDESLSARLLVVAEGANSSTRELLGSSVRRDDYARFGLVANVAFERPHAQRAFERFTRDGPLAVLPLTAGRCNVVWSLPGDRANALKSDDEGFAAALQDTFGYRLGRLRRVGRRHVYPLMRTVARPLHGNNWVLLGNAAHSVHPVAGQGLNLGLRDMAALAELLHDNREAPVTDLLERYVNWRRPDHRHVLTMTDSLVRAFAHEAAPVAALRDAALVALQIAPPLRRWFARRSMGYVGRMPRLARGIGLECDEKAG